MVGYIGRINQKEKERIEDSGRRRQLPRHRLHRQAGRQKPATKKTLHGGTGWEQMETSAGGRPCTAWAAAIRRRRAMPSRLSIDIHLKAGGGTYGERRERAGGDRSSNGRSAGVRQQTRSTPTCSSRHRPRELGRARLHSIDKPLLDRCAARHLSAGLHLPSPSWAWPRWKPAERTAGQHHHGRRLLDLRWPRFRSGHALGPVDLHRSIISQQRVYQLANDMAGVQRDPRLRAAAGLAQGHRPGHPLARRAACCPPPTGSAPPTSAQNSRSGTPAKPSPGHRPRLQQLHHAAAGQRRHAGPPAGASRATWSRRGGTR